MLNKATEPQPQGLHTPHELTMAGKVRLALRRQSRRLYRSLRHPRQRRKGRLRNWLGGRIHDRNLWSFRRGPVANGFAGGLFIGMLPIPAQSLVAGAAGIARGWNLPAAIIATWVSNPFTYVPMFIGARACVTWVYHIFGEEPSIHSLSAAAFKNWKWEEWDWDGMVAFAKHAGPELVLGYVLFGLICALAGYVFVHGLWWLVKHLEEPLHHPRLRKPRPPADLPAGPSGEGSSLK